MRPLPLLLAGSALVALSATLLAPRGNSAPNPSTTRDSLAPAAPPSEPPLVRVDPGCKPTAPIDLRVLPGSASSSGVVRVDYELTLRHDVEDAWVEIHLPIGGEVLSVSSEAGPARRGDVRNGSATVRLPQAQRGIVEVEAVMLIASASDSEAPDAAEPGAPVRLSTMQQARYGDLELDLPTLVAEGETSHVVPSIQRARDAR